MRLRRSLNLVLIAAVATAATAAWYAGRDGGDAPAITDLDPRDASEIVLDFARRDGPGVRLERRRDGWHITAPIERPARDGRIVSALAVLEAPRSGCYETAEHALDAFGLATPRLRMTVDGTSIAFGDRAADGRRYVSAGERFCLLADRYYPLLKGGLDGLARPGVLPPGRGLQRIATPAAEARLVDDAGTWDFTRGQGDGKQWAARWQGAQASAIVLDPPDADLGTVRIATAEAIEDWRIAARRPRLILVPAGADYGLALSAEAAAGLLSPPSQDEAQP